MSIFLSMFKKINENNPLVSSRSRESSSTTLSEPNKIKQNPIDSLTEKQAMIVFSFLNIDELICCSLVNKKWNNISKDQNAWKTIILHNFAFGKEKWKKHFGDVGSEPPLPENIFEILKSPCPAFPKKFVAQTHVLVLLPKLINDFPFTLNNLGELVKEPKLGNRVRYNSISLNVADSIRDRPVDKSQWLLMTKEVLKGSYYLKADVQINMVKELAKRANANYRIPKMIEAATCIFMNFVSTGERLFEMPIRCLDMDISGGGVAALRVLTGNDSDVPEQERKQEEEINEVHQNDDVAKRNAFSSTSKDLHLEKAIKLSMEEQDNLEIQKAIRLSMEELEKQQRTSKEEEKKEKEEIKVAFEFKNTLKVLMGKEPLNPEFISKIKDINSQDEEGKTALMYAVEGGNPVIVNQLINEHANLDIQTINGDTALMIAAGQSSKLILMIIDVLLKGGANKRLPNSNGKTALKIAEEKDNLMVIQKLMDKPEKPIEIEDAEEAEENVDWDSHEDDADWS